MRAIEPRERHPLLRDNKLVGHDDLGEETVGDGPASSLLMKGDRMLIVSTSWEGGGAACHRLGEGG